MATALWKRIDIPGRDAAVLTDEAGSLRLEGMAMFTAAPDHQVTVSYQVQLAQDGALWAQIDGCRGKDRFSHLILREAQGWTLDGVCMGLRHLRHLTLGFTPATSVLLMRKEAICVTSAVGIPAAYFDIGQTKLTERPQHFRRRDRELYDYSTPDRSTMLRVAGDGFIHQDPGLWQREA
ncbi:putative glycolipid-binding domain-containing protein [Falsirhodobacter deserti]|uniref:putative glycolipid-binding domain-containing protein n=1 Tax=Falsirhodobacter deserti TaxID=1365611 RepID=UPI000FE40A68|nr:putative glycolipid-binding domain-containing protein [Falsirhodobacter deserti]